MGDGARYHDYPAFLRVRGRRCVVVGGGPVAKVKAEALVSRGARVTVVAPKVVEELAVAAATGRLAHEPRGYRAGDLRGAFIAVAATGVREVDDAVRDEAARERCLVNVVDAPELSDLIVPAVARRGPLQIAVSTGGTAPAVARRLRERLEEEFGEEWAVYLRLAGEVRVLARSRVPDPTARRAVAEALAAPGVLERVRDGERPDPEALLEELLAAARVIGADAGTDPAWPAGGTDRP